MSEKCRVVRVLGGEPMTICEPKNEEKGDKVVKKKEKNPPKSQEQGASSFVKGNGYHSII